MCKIEILKEFKKEWDEEVLDKVVELWDRNWSYEDMADHLEIKIGEIILILLHLDLNNKLSKREKGIFGTKDNSIVEYDVNNRIQYNELLHQKQGTPWTEEDERYLCQYYGVDDLLTVSLALERTSKSVYQKYEKLRKNGQVDFYRNEVEAS